MIAGDAHEYFRLVVSSINDNMTHTARHAGETVAVRVKESSHADW